MTSTCFMSFGSASMASRSSAASTLSNRRSAASSSGVSPASGAATSLRRDLRRWSMECRCERIWHIHAKNADCST